MIRNKNQFLLNSELYHIDTRQHAIFHQPSVNVAKYQKGVYYLGVKVFNVLPFYIKTEFDKRNLTLILPRSRTGTVWFYTSTSNKRAA